MSAPVTVSSALPVPTVSITSGATSLGSGGSTSVSWTSTNATTCTASGSWAGPLSTAGTQSVGPLTTTSTYAVRCVGTGGSASDSLTVAVSSGALSSTPSAATNSGGGSIPSWLALTLGAFMWRRKLRRPSLSMIRGTMTLAFASVALAPAAFAVDFATRCAQPGVVRCYGFEDPSDIGNRTFGRSSDNQKLMAIDTAQKTSGNSSIKFTIPPLSGADTSGSFFLNFADDLSQRFGEGTEFYVQWRQRFSPEMTRKFLGGNGWKQLIIGAGDYPGGEINYSCSEQETVMQQDTRSAPEGFPSMYHSCGRWETLEFYDGTQIRLQHQGPPYCYYPTDPSNGCMRYHPNEWMTFQVHIKIGHWNVQDSKYEAWVAYEGQSPVKIYDSDLTNGIIYYRNNDLNAAFGKVWLLPYNTNKDPTEDHPTAYTWYDDLIISRNKIADPDATTPVLLPAISLTASPTTIVGSGSSTLNWSATNADACTASGGWSGSKTLSGMEMRGPLTATTTFTLNCTNTQGGSNSASVTVTVSSSSGVPTVTLAASPMTVLSGATSTLTWSSTNATSCTANGSWSGSKAVSGTQLTAALTSSTNAFTLQCVSSSGSTAQATVNVAVTSSATSPPATSATGSSGGGAIDTSLVAGLLGICYFSRRRRNLGTRG